MAIELQLVVMHVSYSKKLQVHYAENIWAFDEYGQKLSQINVKCGGGGVYSSKDFFIAGNI